MKLIKKTYQDRRDFNGIYKCEGCGAEEEIDGCYDDRNFHDNVTPNMKCKSCGQSTITLGTKIQKVNTKYGDDEVV